MKKVYVLVKQVYKRKLYKMSIVMKMMIMIIKMNQISKVFYKKYLSVLNQKKLKIMTARQVINFKFYSKI